MKYLKVVVVLIFAMMSCENVSNESQTNSVDENQIIKEHLIKNGFSVRSIQFDGDKVVLGGDAYFDRVELLKDAQSENLQKQYRTNYIVSQSRASDIKVYIYSSVYSSWKTAIRSAIGDWNAITNTKLYFREVTSSSSANIKFNMGSLSYGAIAQAQFPTSSGYAGSSITISTTNYNLTTSQKRFAMAHEMGHCIGFRHTNWFDRNSDGNATTNDNEGAGTYGANHIPGTPTGLDSYSVMNAIVASWSGFSYYDVVATRYLYP